MRERNLNVGTLIGKTREMIHMMQRREADILCVWETRWKGSKAQSLGVGLKLFCHYMDGKRNGVSVILKEKSFFDIGDSCLTNFIVVTTMTNKASYVSLVRYAFLTNLTSGGKSVRVMR